MALMFPTIMAIPPGLGGIELDKEYKVGTGRRDNVMVIYVTKNHDKKYHKEVGLKWRWWQLTSPAERVRRATAKAQKIADRLNHAELYMEHEADISVRAA